ncbi:MAG: hypothetical protein ACRDRM_02440 [Pseudonocardiaceae bacterium]
MAFRDRRAASARTARRRPFPLGAHSEGGGVRFAVASSVAESVEVCLLSPDGAQERRVLLTERRPPRCANRSSSRVAPPPADP